MWVPWNACVSKKKVWATAGGGVDGDVAVPPNGEPGEDNISCSFNTDTGAAAVWAVNLRLSPGPLVCTLHIPSLVCCVSHPAPGV